MKTVTICLEKYKTPEELHADISKMLKFPAYYGANLDALFDCLTEICEPVILKIPQVMTEKYQLGDYGKKLVCVIEHAATENPNIQLELI